jgi:hypothetical protein
MGIRPEAWMGTFSLTRTVRRRAHAAAASLIMLALAGLVCTSATAAQASDQIADSSGSSCPASASAVTGTITGWSSNVPWHSVGQGWILGDLAKSADGRGTLYLVSPGGQRYRLGQAPASSSLEDWSGNGTYALLLSQGMTSTTGTIIVLNLHTGQTHSFKVYSSSPYPTMSFSRPGGSAVLFAPGTTSSGSTLPVQRFSLTGGLELCYPTQYPQAGAVSGGYLENASGTELVFETQSGLEVVSNSGQPIRYIVTRGPSDSCQLLNWWSNDSVVVACGAQLLTYPLSGGRAGQLTGSRDGGTFLGAWHLPSGTYAQAAACGTTWLEKLNSNGTASTLTIPGAADAGTVQPLGTYGNQLPLLLGGGCDGHFPYSFVDWYKPSTNVAKTVLGGPAGGGYVTGAVLYRTS